MQKIIIRYAIAVVLVLSVIAALVIVMRSAIVNSGIETKAERRVVMTPAVLDSIRAIRQWELAAVPVSAVIDTVQRRWMGLVKDRISKKYEGVLSVGIDMGNIEALRYRVEGDTITVILPDVGILDDNFMDETRTVVLRSDNDDFEARPDVRRDMLERARNRMMSEGLSSVTLSACRSRAKEEVTRSLQAIGYHTVIISFDRVKAR